MNKLKYECCDYMLILFILYLNNLILCQFSLICVVYDCKDDKGKGTMHNTDEDQMS
jgi:hypothetical protein